MEIGRDGPAVDGLRQADVVGLVARALLLVGEVPAPVLARKLGQRELAACPAERGAVGSSTRVGGIRALIVRGRSPAGCEDRVLAAADHARGERPVERPRAVAPRVVEVEAAQVRVRPQHIGQPVVTERAIDRRDQTTHHRVAGPKLPPHPADEVIGEWLDGAFLNDAAAVEKWPCSFGVTASSIAMDHPPRVLPVTLAAAAIVVWSGSWTKVRARPADGTLRRPTDPPGKNVTGVPDELKVRIWPKEKSLALSTKKGRFSRTPSRRPRG